MTTPAATRATLWKLSTKREPKRDPQVFLGWLLGTRLRLLANFLRFIVIVLDER